MKPRSSCTCFCHNDHGIKVMHIAACCRPDPVKPVYCEGRVGSRPWWMGQDQWDGGCRCVLAPNHDGDCLCEHDMDNAA